MLTQHFWVSQIISWNWKHTAKCSLRKPFDTWYYIAICATLYLSFSSKSKATNVFPKHILKSKVRDQSIQARKKLFCHVMVKDYLCNVLCKVFIKIERTRMRKTMKHPRWHYCTMIGLSEAATKAVLKAFVISSQETLVLESLFKKLHVCKPAILLKRDPNTGVFLWILRNF